MSSIGAANIGSVHLAGSVSAGQQVKPGRDQSKAESLQQDFRATLESISDKHAENVDEASLGADRDADGRRMDDGFDDSESQPENSFSNDSHRYPIVAANKPQDAFGELGAHLDLDA